MKGLEQKAGILTIRVKVCSRGILPFDDSPSSIVEKCYNFLRLLCGPQSDRWEM